MEAKKKRGGSREGSGRPKGIKTAILTVRVSIDILEELKEYVKKADADYRKKIN